MAVIVMPSGSDVIYARWAYHRFIDATKEVLANDKEAVAKLIQSDSLDGLHLEMINPDLSERIFGGLYKATKNLESKRDLSIYSEDQHDLEEQFVMAVDELLALMEKEKMQQLGD